VAAHRSLALPLQLVGQAHRWTTEFNGSPFHVLGVGRWKLVHTVCHSLLGELPRASHGHRRALWNPRSLARQDADLIVVEIHRWMAARFRRAGWRIVPDAVRWKGDLAHVPPAQPNASLRDDLRKVRQHRYRLVQSQAAEDWDLFYHQMLKPQVARRFGATGWLPSRRFISDIARVGTLHFVVRGEERVAGICCVIRRETFWIPLTAIRGGDPGLLHQGAGAAALALSLAWARAQGCRDVDLGRSRPFLREGIPQYKYKWGLRPAPDPLAHLTAIAIRSASARRAFAANPVLVEQGSNLVVYAGEEM
jgi:hypothetical protein